MVSPIGLKPMTYPLGGDYSIQLSYGDIYIINYLNLISNIINIKVAAAFICLLTL